MRMKPGVVLDTTETISGESMRKELESQNSQARE